MIQHLVKVYEILKDRELRSWAKFRLLNLHDSAPQNTFSKYPDYLSEELGPKYFKNRNSEVIFPKLISIAYDKNKDDYNLFLATQVFNHKNSTISSEDLIDLHFELDDEEDCESLFRYNSLLRNIETSNTFGDFEISLLNSWIESSKLPSSAFHPYTISERLSNFAIFLCRCFKDIPEDKVDFEKLFNKVSYEAKHLFQNLEFKGDLTCNHLSNNGRGLMWAGVLLNNQNLILLGLKIMKKEYKRIVQDDGMIREGSSHYQLLITRNYYEAFWISKVMKISVDESQEMFLRLLNASHFFSVNGKIPFFGDISPDNPPDWFFDLLDINFESNETRPSKGWASHFFREIPVAKSKYQADGTYCLDEYVRINKNDFAIFQRINKRGYPLINGHVHCDSASPIIFYRNDEFLIDPGRKSYLDQDIKYLKANSHNSFLIDNRPFEIPQRAFFGDKFKESRFAQISQIASGSEVSVEIVNPFEKKLIIQKRLQVIKNQIVMSFIIKSKTSHKLDFFFYLGDNVSIKTNDQDKVEEVFKSCELLSSKSYQYGRSIPTRSKHFRAHVLPNQNLSFTFSYLS